MNCQEFNDRLYDYVDETLGSEAQAAAREHLRQCGECRRAVMREKAVARSIRHSLDRATAGLSIRPEMLRNVLTASESKAIRTNILVQIWEWFISKPLRPVGAGAALLGALVLMAGLQARRPPTENSASRAVTEARQNAWVIDVPIQTQIHVFRRQNGTVIDAITPSVVFGHARFLQPENSTKSL
jgi:hypothetical protein